MRDRIHIDFETFSEADLTEVGEFRYAEDPTTQILCCAIALNDDEPYLWRRDVAPDDLPGLVRRDEAWGLLKRASRDPDVEVWAHNAKFEMAISEQLWEKTFNSPCPARNKWRCTMAMARKACMPAGMEKLAEYLELKNQKDKGGKDLIKMFSMLQTKETKTGKGKNRILKYSKGQRITPRDEPESFRQFCDYCLQDVKVEQEVADVLSDFELQGGSLATFLLDLEINAEGMPVNVAGLRKAQALIEEQKLLIATEFQSLTGFNVTQGKVLLPWAKARGYRGDDLQADTITMCLFTDNLTDQCREALRLKQRVGSASVNKVASMLACVCRDGRIRGTHTYHGANTGRWTSTLVQTQNLKKPTIKNTYEAYADICDGMSSAMIEVWYGSTLDVIGSCIRHFIHDITWCEGIESGETCMYPEEFPFLDGDYAAIEGRIICWVAGEQEALDEYTRGLDRYVVMACGIYKGQEYADLKARSKAEEMEAVRMRFIGKTAILGLGFMMGAERFVATCAQDDVEISMELAETTVEAFREKHPSIVEFWRDIERQCKNAINHPGQKFFIGDHLSCHVRNVAEKPCLFIRLPSGRHLCYPDVRIGEPKVIKRPGKKAFTTTPIVFWGKIKQKSIWGWIETYSGKLAENVVQAIAADLMSHGARQARAAGYRICALIHDEALSLFRDTSGGRCLEDYLARLSTLPTWAAGLPMKTEGKVVPFYTKG